MGMALLPNPTTLADYDHLLGMKGVKAGVFGL